ncbi:MAG TPA: VIT1/CCC1 transporter family protein [Candidatus Paceibacterota bacterium]|nr:VIT1/CCC1 transporter family protein [Candidatus Paceibacterota bacterium]
MLKHKKYLPDFIFGAIDGLVTTFAIVSSVVGASLSVTIILILGFANLFADGFSMAISNYLSSKSGEDLNHNMSGRKPIISGAVTFFAFVLIGFIPLLAFVFDFGKNNFLISIFLTGVAFVMVGYVKGLITEKNKFLSSIQTLSIGALAAVIAYFVGYFIASLGV